MRTDAFIWSVRLFKTRTQAAKACQGSKVEVNGQVVKPSRSIKIGDRIVIRRGAYTQHFRVLALLKSRIGAKLVSEYVEDITPDEELKKKALFENARASYQSYSMGKPTKKERRKLSELKIQSFNKGKDDEWDLFENE
jgi:ribosome-associated heat shock protein Hsp15